MANTGDITYNEEIQYEMEGSAWPLKVKTVQINRKYAFEHGGKAYTSLRLVEGPNISLHVDSMYYLSNGAVLGEKDGQRFIVPGAIIVRADLI